MAPMIRNDGSRFANHLGSFMRSQVRAMPNLLVLCTPDSNKHRMIEKAAGNLRKYGSVN
jgi:hypothetical protein